MNTLSPGYIRTNLVADQLDSDPEMLSRWSDANPLGRIGRPHELRGVIVWLASSASSFCNGADIIVSGGHLFEGGGATLCTEHLVDSIR